jgi:hypothetical protein
MAPKKSGPMCIVTLNHHDFLMPVATGMKIVQLMGEAVECNSTYERGLDYTYTVGKPVKIEFTTVRHDQIRMPAEVKTFRLEHQRD